MKQYSPKHVLAAAGNGKNDLQIKEGVRKGVEMLREFIIFLAGMGVSAILVGVLLFVKMGRENARLRRHLLKIASGVAHGNAMQQTIHGPELDARSVEFQRTRAMAQRDLGLETDDEMIASGD